MRSKFKWIFTLFMVFTMQFSFAQEKTVTGVVSDASGPLPGVNVVVRGTQRGTATGFDGRYSIKAKEGEVLVFSFMGMSDVSKTVGASNDMNVTMKDESTKLNEVVVVGYSTTKKRDFVGSIKEVKSEQLSKKNVSSVTQALAGEVAGVRVINTSGQPGTVGTVRVRGLGSVNGNRSPLYVVDGVPYSGRIESINPNDIASTSVLKDATATAIYGARGANGVILITTKNAKKGESFVEIESRTGFNFSALPRYETIKSPEEYISLGWEGLYNQGVIINNANPLNYANNNLFSGLGVASAYNMWNVASGADLIDPATGMVRSGVTRKYNPENWEDYAFQNSIRTETNLSMGGASEKSRYYSSIGYLNDKGYSINSDFERITGRLSLTQDVKEWLKASTNIGYTMSTTNQGGQSEDSGSVFWFVDNIPSIYPLFMRDANGNILNNIYGKPAYDYGESGRGFGALTNAIADAYYTLERAKRQEISTNSSFDVKISNDLTFETKIGTQYYERKFDNLNNKYFGPSAGTNGSIFKTDIQMFTYNFLKLLRYKKVFGVHDLEVLGAHENNSYEYKYLSASKNEMALPIPEFEQAAVNIGATSYTDNVKLESFFSQLNYNFDKKYFFTGTIRRDGSSRFLKDKWGNFWSLGLAWNVTNENFMKDQTLFSNLKVKTSYGLTGEQDGVGLYPGYDRYNTDTGAGGTISFPFSSKGNPNLTWETSKMFQAGVEFDIKDRFEASIDVYRKLTDDLLFQRRVAISDGYAIINVNDGQLENRGLEFDLTGHILKGKDGYLDLSINGEILDNKLLRMPIDPSTGKEKTIDVQGLYGRAVGHSIYDFYLREWAGVDPATGQAMWVQHYDDANGNGAVDTGEGILSLTDYLTKNPDRKDFIEKTNVTNYALATQKFVGKSIIPDVRGAVNLSAGYKGFDFSVQMLYSFGGYAYDSAYANLMNNGQAGQNNWHVDIRDRWQQPGDVTNVPRLSNNQDANVASASTRFLTKADYINLNNIRLGYNVPKRYTEQLKLASLSIFVSGDNLYLSAYRKGFNPTVSETGASSQYTYSPLSTISGGVRLKF
ncbi:SusC/RagA family TonB-linked outer membrane protein [Flavobacterium luminosum]|uniref:SusC/RagA family TonB-linked outer membrane protein n=1 Tax=Flavobacterium luminosum TaxID=2949086 RepID=A0ABT0TK74_9FLAO|nr:SusC/RagA family TonB-linked outer membrane protein [Flavobacterium sp. HXWNR70]MCL9807902.1 SusC/RagA family TonB-linked outer membrane protein [Flavobacterium sp. HXWNR70]